MKLEDLKNKEQEVINSVKNNQEVDIDELLGDVGVSENDEKDKVSNKLKSDLFKKLKLVDPDSEDDLDRIFKLAQDFGYNITPHVPHIKTYADDMVDGHLFTDEEMNTYRLKLLDEIHQNDKILFYEETTLYAEDAFAGNRYTYGLDDNTVVSITFYFAGEYNGEVYYALAIREPSIDTELRITRNDPEEVITSMVHLLDDAEEITGYPPYNKETYDFIFALHDAFDEKVNSKDFDEDDLTSGKTYREKMRDKSIEELIEYLQDNEDSNVIKITDLRGMEIVSKAYDFDEPEDEYELVEIVDEDEK